jgi:histidine triad (HIT) family protein
MDCIFCKIIAGGIPSSKVFENDSVYAFDDINPLAPVHVLIIPKKHVENAGALSAQEAGIMADLFSAAQEIAALKGINESGYRVITNSGPDSGQEVYHLHLHLLGGRKLGYLVGTL